MPVVRFFNPPWHPTGMSVLSLKEAERMCRAYAPEAYPLFEAMAELQVVKQGLSGLAKAGGAVIEYAKAAKAALRGVETYLFLPEGTVSASLPSLTTLEAAWEKYSSSLKEEDQLDLF
jgi:hypothetical protein